MSRIRFPSRKTRSRLLWAAVAFVVVLGAALVAAHWSTARTIERTLEAFRTEVGPLDPDFYRKPRVADAENAALSYLAAAEALGLAIEKSELLRSLASGDSDWEDEGEDSVQAALDLLGPVREHLSRANNLPSSSYGVDYSEVMTSGLRDMLSLLRLQRVLLVEARLASRRGDAESLLASTRSSAGVAASLRQEGLLICTLLAIAAEKTTLQIIAETLESGATREILDGFSRDLEKLDQATLPLGAVFATEGAFVYQMMSETPEETADWKPSRFQRVLLGWLVDRMNIGAFDLYRELVAAADHPFTDLSRRLDGDGALRAHTVTGKVRSIIAPNLIDAVARYQAALSSRQLAAAAIEIRRLGLERGEYPPESALAGLLEPSPYSGERPDYERLEDGSARLGYPQAADLWRDRNTQVTLTGRTRLEWVLPPLS